MVAHEAIAEDGDSGVCQIIPQKPQVGVPIVVGGEDLTPVDAGQRDVARQPWDHTAVASRHRRIVHGKPTQFRLSPFSVPPSVFFASLGVPYCGDGPA